MRRFYDLQGILSIPEDEMELIGQQAADGDPVACYKLARVHLCLHDCDDYVRVAHELLVKAQKGGVSDAGAAIAAMMFKGELEPYDPSGAAMLLEEALKNNSEYAAYFQLLNLLYGRYGYNEDPELVLKTLDGLIAESDNPYWYSLKGDALSYLGKSGEALPWYEKAVEGGVISAYGDLAMARGMNDDGSFRDYDAFCDTLVEGNDMRDPMCMYYMAMNRMFEYDEIDPEDEEIRTEYRDLIVKALELCAEDCLSVSFELLGDIYREGRIGVPADPIKAWQYYVNGSEFYLASCFGKMYDMLQADEIALGKVNSEDAMDLCAVNGARLHDKRLLAATVERYRRGRLTQFAREIEMYHIPAYDAIPDDEPLDDDEEDYPDDDGRNDAWA